EIVSAARPMNPAEQIISFARPSYVCDSNDLHKINFLCEGIIRWSQTRGEQFVREHKDDAIMVWYGSDCTPLSTKERLKRALGNLQVIRHGRSSDEYLMQRVFLQSANGDTAAIIKDPMQLSDKTAATHFEAYWLFFPLPRAIGAEGIVLHAYCWDGAIFHAMDQLVRKYHAAYNYNRSAQEQFPGEGRRLELMSWHLAVSCVNHICHGAMRWSLLHFINDKDCVRSCFISIESLRNSFGQLVSHLEGGWLQGKIEFEQWDGLDIGELWSVLGVEPDWAERLTDMQVRWGGGLLKVAPRYQSDPALIESLSACFLHIWAFRKFSDSRWISLGRSCRVLLASMVLGLEALVADILASPGQSNYYMSGFQRLRGKTKQMVAIAGTSSFVSDTVLASLLEDDRLPLMLGRLEQEIHEELHFVNNISDGVWQVLAGAVDYPGPLRTDAINAATVSAGFIQKGLSQAREPPRLLCVGDLDANPDQLISGSVPQEETTWKIYELARLGFNRALLKDGLKLMGQAGWSSTTTEQAHVTASGVMKQHHEYGQQTMRARSALLQTRPVLLPDPEVVKMSVLQRRLENLQKKNPAKINGRHIYFKDL
ncbi:unnamed protein product, partial [Polarella glacialis]